MADFREQPTTKRKKLTAFAKDVLKFNRDDLLKERREFLKLAKDHKWGTDGWVDERAGDFLEQASRWNDRLEHDRIHSSSPKRKRSIEEKEIIEYHGGAIHLIRGSKEAKIHMARLRALRKK